MNIRSQILTLQQPLSTRVAVGEQKKLHSVHFSHVLHEHHDLFTNSLSITLQIDLPVQEL